jgi:phenylpropionate dioxygenase-like ring-hydroxylating dioxygenase large terminal subunit
MSYDRLPSELDKFWFPVAHEEQVGRKPTVSVLLNCVLQLFREPGSGELVALRVGAGARGARGFLPARARDGLVWVSLAPESPEPPAWPFMDKVGFRDQAEVGCHYVQLIENMMDASHAGFVHGGLLRGKPSNLVRYLVEETETGVVKSNRGEKASRSLLYRLFGSGSDEFCHIERYLVPHTVRAEYRTLEGETIFSTQFVCAPSTPGQTRIFYRVCVNADSGWQRRMGKMIVPILRPLVRKVMAQDRAILELEQRTIRDLPADVQRVFSVADVAAIWSARRAFDPTSQGASIGRARSKEFELRL